MFAPYETACRDWESRILAGQTLIPETISGSLNKAMADKAERIFRRLKVVDQPGMPTMGEICRPWVIEWVRVIFGCIDPETKARAIQNFLMLIPKKNGKSTIAAGIMLTALIMNERYGGEFLILAPTKEIADNSFEPAFGMIKNDPALDKTFKANDITRTIEHRILRSSLQVKAANAESVGGTKAIGVLIDELWLFGKKADAANMLSEATGAMASMAEGFVIYLTTQSDEAPAGVFADKLKYHRNVRDGKIADSNSFQVIYELPERMLKAGDWKDLANAYIVNPNLGASVRMPFLQQKLNEALGGGNAALRLFAAKHLNVEIGVGLRTDGWAGAEFWEARTDPTLTFETLLDRCEAVCIGIDGGGLDDLFGFAAIGREIETQRWLAWITAFADPIIKQRRPGIAPILDGFALAKELEWVAETAPAEVIDGEEPEARSIDDIDRIIEMVEMVKDRDLLAAVCADPAGIGTLVDALKKIGVTEEAGNLRGIAQGMGLMNSIKTCERKLKRGSMVHAPSGLSNWCVGNLKIEAMATAIRATKIHAGEKKIDPAIAMFNAGVVMSENPQPVRTRSIYNTRRLRVA